MRGFTKSLMGALVGVGFLLATPAVLADDEVLSPQELVPGGEDLDGLGSIVPEPFVDRKNATGLDDQDAQEALIEDDADTGAPEGSDGSSEPALSSVNERTKDTAGEAFDRVVGLVEEAGDRVPEEPAVPEPPADALDDVVDPGAFEDVPVPGPGPKEVGGHGAMPQGGIPVPGMGALNQVMEACPLEDLGVPTKVLAGNKCGTPWSSFETPSGGASWGGYDEETDGPMGPDKAPHPGHSTYTLPQNLATRAVSDPLPYHGWPVFSGSTGAKDDSRKSPDTTGGTPGGSPLVPSGTYFGNIEAIPVDKLPIALGMVVVAGLVAWRFEWLIIKPLQLLGLRLFTHIREDKVMDNKSRERLFLIVRQNPGVQLQEIVNLTGFSRSTIRYHVKVLCQHGKVAVFKEQKNMYLYPRELVDSAGMHQLLKELPNPLDQEIVKMLKRRPGASQKEIATQIGVNLHKIRRHMLNLVERGVCRLERAPSVGEPHEYYLTPGHADDGAGAEATRSSQGPRERAHRSKGSHEHLSAH